MHFEPWVEASEVTGGKKGDLQLVCGRLTSQHSRMEKKKELSETLSNNDFYKISKGGFILWKLNAEL